MSEPATIEQRLRRLEDIEEIRRLRMRYHVNINEERFGEMPALFTEDAVVDFGHVGGATGLADIEALFLALPSTLDLVKQFIHNHLVDVEGDRATGLAYLDARYARAGESVMVAARFDEVYRRTGDGWRIAEMRVHLFFAVPISEGWAGKSDYRIQPFR